MRKRITLGVVVAVVGFFLIGQIAMSESEEEAVSNVNLIQLLTVPEKYAGKWVRVIAFGVFEFESSSIFTSRDAAELGDMGSQLFVAGDFSRKDLNGRYVVVEAKFVWSKKYKVGNLDEVRIIGARKRIQTFE